MPYTTGPVVTDQKFTGQKLDSTRLYYYNARYYDPALGAFISPDTIVPDPTNLLDYNRYSYVRGNPLKYNDPSGHCAFATNSSGKEFISKTDCTLDDFQALDWDDRKRWMGLFVNENDLEDWFDDIKGTIDILAADGDYNNMDGWAAYMDAAVLQAINDGMNLFSNREAVGAEGTHGGEAWRAFFGALDRGMKNTDPNQLIVLRLSGEQGGVNYALGLTETSWRYQAESTRVQLKVDWFLWGTNLYRERSMSCRSAGSCWVDAYSDPRQATETRLFRFLGTLPGVTSRMACPLCE